MSIIKSKKSIFLFVVVNLFLVVVTAIITTCVIKSKSNNDYLAVINEDLIYSKALLFEKQNSVCSTIDAKACELPGKYVPIAEHARSIELETNYLVDQIDDIIEDIIDDCGGNDDEYTGAMNNKGDRSAASVILESDKDARKLQENVNNYKRLLLGSIYDTSTPSYKFVLANMNYLNSFVNDENRMDQKVLYADIPSIGTINLLLQLQIKIRLSAIETLQYMINNFESLDIRISGLSAYTNEQNKTLNTGDTFVSQIGLLAIDTTIRPMVYVCYSEPFYDSVVSNGAMQYMLCYGQSYDTIPFSSYDGCLIETKCSAPGKHLYGGLVHYRSNRGDLWLPFNGDYYVR